MNKKQNQFLNKNGAEQKNSIKLIYSSLFKK